MSRSRSPQSNAEPLGTADPLRQPDALAGSSQNRFWEHTVKEWPTWLALLACYGGWAVVVWHHEALGGWLFAALAGYLVALHASLQHEVLHGHPTRSRAVNEALVFPSLNLFIPYRRFRDTHLRHHHDERLTDPYDDPESWYLSADDARALSAPMTMVLRFNSTLGGRLLIGPFLSVFGLFRADVREGGPRIVDAYLRHLIGITLVLAYVWGVCGLNPLWYILLASWPGLSFLMLRTFAEHQAAVATSERTAIVEAEAPLAFLFLNNNLHAVHHANPSVSWFALPELWRQERAQVLERNGGYYLPGYATIAWRWMFRSKEPIAHPYRRTQCVERGRPVAVTPTPTPTHNVQVAAASKD